MLADGLVRVDTWVDTTRNGPSLVTVLGFRDEAALERFLDDPATDLLGQVFDEFIGPHAHLVSRRRRFTTRRRSRRHRARERRRERPATQ